MLLQEIDMLESHLAVLRSTALELVGIRVMARDVDSKPGELVVRFGVCEAPIEMDAAVRDSVIKFAYGKKLDELRGDAATLLECAKKFVESLGAADDKKEVTGDTV